MSEIILTIEGLDLRELYGHKNGKLNLLKEAYQDLTITSRGNTLKISGEAFKMHQAKRKLEMMVQLLRDTGELTKHTIIDLLGGDNPIEYKLGNGKNNTTIVHDRNGKPIKAKTKNQRRSGQVGILKGITGH